MFRNPRKRSSRRAWPIHAYVGPNGSGKSLAMVWDTLPSLSAGRPVLSTVRLLDWENPRPCEGCEVCATGEVVGQHLQAHPLYVPLRDWSQLLDARSADVLLDEVTGVASSRESHSMPAPVANKLVQLRRADVVVRWSAPSWTRADKIIRETTQAATVCRGYLPKVVPGDDAETRMWRSRRFFRWRTHDACDLEDFTVGKAAELPSIVTDLYWGPGSPAFDAYDTFDSVETVGTVTDSGRCYRCGGRRSIPACKCAPADGHPVVTLAAEEGPPQGDTGAAGVASGGRRRLVVLD
ncbi:MAG: zonular occludens toxin domain-containing protein [Dermatophilaceae bacterium]